jgi:hypothetical protein
MLGHLEENQLLNQDFKDILSAFCDQQVEFIVVGGYAMAFHGFLRATGDIDLWIRCSMENAEKVWLALQDFKAPLFDLTKEDLNTYGIVFQIGIVPNRIDITTKIDGVNFDDAWKNHQTVQIEGLTIPVLNKEFLLLNKKVVSRPKDLIDIIWLESNK